MTTESNPYPRVEFLIDSFADWLKHRRELNEMRQMNRAEFDRIADDLERVGTPVGPDQQWHQHAARADRRQDIGDIGRLYDSISAAR